MSDEDRERIMNFIIQRQEEFASQMVQQQEQMAHQQALTAYMQKALVSMIEAQERTSADVANLTAFTKRLADFVAPPNGGNA